MAEESKVTPKDPQTKKALDIKDPSNVDDTATYNYNTSVDFEVKEYVTFLQGPGTNTTPKSFPGSDVKYAPTSSPFIIEIRGSGFNTTAASSDPFKIYAELDGYIALIPPLPTSVNLDVGNSFGYVIKSNKTIWIYFNRLVFQEIWFKPVTKTFDGEESPYKIQLESGNEKYPLSSGVKPLTLHFAVNVGTLLNKSNYFVENGFKDIVVTLTQSPYIITIQGGGSKGNVVPPSIEKENGKIKRFISLFGHSLVRDSSRKVVMIKTTSKLLSSNPSALPQDILSADQSSTAIQNMDAQKLSSLEYFKVGFFLNDLQSKKASNFSAYNYFSAGGTIVNSGDKGHLPEDALVTFKFEINTIPVGTYYVVVYDSQTGAYSYAPDPITINRNIGAIQIHDVSPKSIVLQSPSFTVNGFGFPTTDDINNGATFTVNLVRKNDSLVSGLQSSLQINKSSPTNDINNNGSITLNSDLQFVVKFTNLNTTTTFTDDSVFLLAKVTYAKQNIKAGKINENAKSLPIGVKKAPSIEFLTNVQAAPPDNSKALVRVDQATGQVIAYGVPTNELYIVGKNFGSEKDTTVLVKGVSQKINSVSSWQPNPNFQAIKVTIDPGNIKGDATVEVRIDGISTEPFGINFSQQLKTDQTTTNAKGIFIKKDISIITPVFKTPIPYNHFDGHTLLNNKNTKVAASVPLKLINIDTQDTISLNGSLDANSAVPISFVPDKIVVPAKTVLSQDRTFSVVFNFYSIFNVNLSTPKIVRLQDKDGNYQNTVFKAGDKMTVVGTGFVNGMRYNINETGWKPVAQLNTLPLDPVTKTIYQAFTVDVPDSKGTQKANIRVSNDDAQSVSSSNAAGKQNGQFNVSSIVLNDKYSPLLKINQRLPAGIKMYAKGPQIAMTDKIDANMSVYSQMTPFLGSFKIVLIVIRIIVCIIDVICALINPFQLIVAIIALMDCIIDLLSLFPQLAVPIMILSFLQNFIGFLQTFITQIIAYVFSLINSQLALVKAQLSKDFAALAAAEQMAFGIVKQLRDVIAFLEPPLAIIQIFKDLLNFAMHFPCAANQGGSQNNGQCPPGNIQKLIQEMIEDKVTPSSTSTSIIAPGGLVRFNNIVTVTTTKSNTFKVGDQIILSPGEIDFPISTNKLITTIIDEQNFTYEEVGINTASSIQQTAGAVLNSDQQATLATMFCQAVSMQTATLQTMPGFNGLDSFGNPLTSGPLAPGSTSVIPPVIPNLPNIASAIECLNNLTDNIETALNAGQTYITTEQQGEELVAAYTQCVQNLIDQTNQSLGDVCVLAISALNSELKVSPKGSVSKDLNDDFIKAKIALPSIQPNDQQDSGLVIDLAKLKIPGNIPLTITTDPVSSNTNASLNFGLKQDIYTPVIISTTNKSGKRQSVDTIYFNAENADVGDLIVPGDILEIVGSPFNGLQFPILAVQKIFTAVRLTTKLDVTAEQKLLVGEQKIPTDLSGFDVKVIAHLAGNDAVAVVPADDESLATVQIVARDHHGHEIGPGLANKVAITIESGDAKFVPIIPSETTDITGVIQEQGDHYIANLKADCAGTVIVSASVCNVELVDIGYHANDPNHSIVTRRKTIKILFTPPIPKPTAGKFNPVDRPQVPGTHFDN